MVIRGRYTKHNLVADRRVSEIVDIIISKNQSYNIVSEWKRFGKTNDVQGKWPKVFKKKNTTIRLWLSRHSQSSATILARTHSSEKKSDRKNRTLMRIHWMLHISWIELQVKLCTHAIFFLFFCCFFSVKNKRY